MIVLFLKVLVVLRKCQIMFYRSKENQKSQNKNVQYNIYLMPHSGSGFDSYVILNNLPQGRSVVKLIENGAGITSL